MSRRHPNPRLAKIHRNYTVEEVAGLFGVHRNTVRNWVKRGLPTSDDRRPMLILGRDLGAFLHARRAQKKRPCKSGEIYCVRCREPRRPAGDMADYEPATESLGNLIGICPECDALMYRRVNPAKLELVRGQLEITMPKASRRICGAPLRVPAWWSSLAPVAGERERLLRFGLVQMPMDGRNRSNDGSGVDVGVRGLHTVILAPPGVPSGAAWPSPAAQGRGRGR